MFLSQTGGRRKLQIKAYVNQKNETVIPTEYDAMADRWCDHVLTIEKDETAACIDEKNEILLQLGNAENMYVPAIVSYGILETYVSNEDGC